MFILAECALPQAIWRDGYRCMFSGKIDEATYDSLQATIEQADRVYLATKTVANGLADRANRYTKEVIKNSKVPPPP